jgi:acylphosphatase
MVRVHVMVSGQVQGVFYRQSCAERAAAAGLAGWVQNRLDGRVEAELEGEQAAVDELVEWMRSGPPLAEVTDVEVTSAKPTGDAGFVVL